MSNHNTNRQRRSKSTPKASSKGTSDSAKRQPTPKPTFKKPAVEPPPVMMRVIEHAENVVVKVAQAQHIVNDVISRAKRDGGISPRHAELVEESLCQVARETRALVEEIGVTVRVPLIY